MAAGKTDSLINGGFHRLSRVWGSSIHKLKRIQIRIIQFEVQPDRLFGQPADIAAGFPGDGTVKRVAEDLIAVRYREPRYRRSVGTPQCDADTSGSRG